MTPIKVRSLPKPPPGRAGWPWTDDSIETAPQPSNGWDWPLISIVTSSYNRVAFLEETIRAVLLQGYPRLQYGIVDGGSTDGTLDVINKYRDFLAFALSEKDYGEYHAYNKGFRLCTGDIITFNSSDDIYLPGTLFDVARHYLQARGIGAIVGGFMRMNARSQPVSEPISALFPSSGPVDLTTVDPHSWRLHQQATFYTREALDNIGRYVRQDLKYTGDRELLYRVCCKYGVVLSQAVYAMFRSHQGSLTGGSPMQQFKMNLEYAGLHFCYHSDGFDGRRKKIGRIFLAKAHLKRAKARANVRDACRSALKAIIWQPSLLVAGSYWRTLRGIFLPSDE